MVKSLVGQLKETLIASFAFQGDVFSENPTALVWVLIVGILSAGKESPKWTWFQMCLERACYQGGGTLWEHIQNIANVPNHVSPKSFYWVLQEIWLHPSAVNTRIL